MVVLGNDGVGEQDTRLLTEVVDVIDTSLPLIGRTNGREDATDEDARHNASLSTLDRSTKRHTLTNSSVAAHCVSNGPS